MLLQKCVQSARRLGPSRALTSRAEGVDGRIPPSQRRLTRLLRHARRGARGRHFERWLTSTNSRSFALNQTRRVAPQDQGGAVACVQQCMHFQALSQDRVLLARQAAAAAGVWDSPIVFGAVRDFGAHRYFVLSGVFQMWSAVGSAPHAGVRQLSVDRRMAKLSARTLADLASISM